LFSGWPARRGSQKTVSPTAVWPIRILGDAGSGFGSVCLVESAGGSPTLPPRPPPSGPGLSPALLPLPGVLSSTSGGGGREEPGSQAAGSTQPAERRPQPINHRPAPESPTVSSKPRTPLARNLSPTQFCGSTEYQPNENGRPSFGLP
jgi:hypothetical protein